jgi:outer membrane protein assembly factor BamB
MTPFHRSFDFSMRKKSVLVTMVLIAAALISGCAGGAVRGTTWAGLNADAESVYLADGPHVYGINLSDGRELWRFPAETDSKLLFYSKPVIAPDGLIIVGSAGGNHTLFAINPADVTTEGDNKSPVAEWTFDGAGGAWVAAPLIVGDLLFAPNSDGSLYVLNLSDGQSVKQAVKIIELGGRLWAEPVSDGKNVFVTSLDHSVYAIDVETFEIIWHQDVKGAIPGSPVIGADRNLYVGSLASQLEKFDPATGSHESVLEAGNWIWSTPTQDGDTLYFGDLSGNFYSFNTSTGALNWAPIQPDGAITGNAIFQNDHLLLATESGNIYAIGKDGKTLWFEGVGGKIYSTPVAVGDLILVAPLETDFYLAALDTNGRQVWTFPQEK